MNRVHKPRKAATSITLSPDVLAWLREQAEANRLSVSAIVNLLLSRELERYTTPDTDKH
jgi:hypothetical protein